MAAMAWRELENERLALENQTLLLRAQQAEIEVAVAARQALLNAYGKLDDDLEWAFYRRVSNVLRRSALRRPASSAQPDPTVA
jgi:hypothetical protein